MATELKCPGQDRRYWKFADIFESMCARCGRPVVFFKDDPKRTCPHCGRDTLNPRNDLAGAAGCKSAKECLEQLNVRREQS